MSSTLLGIATQVMVMAIAISVVLLFAGIAVLVLIHVCIFARATGGRSSAAAAAAERGEACGTAMIGLSEDELEKLPCYNYRENGRSPVVCVVCLDNFQTGDRCRLLPVCQHSFHTRCVDSWLMKNSVCPICRSSADHQKALEEKQAYSSSRTGFGSDEN